MNALYFDLSCKKSLNNNIDWQLKLHSSALVEELENPVRETVTVWDIVLNGLSQQL